MGLHCDMKNAVGRKRKTTLIQRTHGGAGILWVYWILWDTSTVRKAIIFYIFCPSLISLSYDLQRVL